MGASPPPRWWRPRWSSWTTAKTGGLDTLLAARRRGPLERPRARARPGWRCSGDQRGPLDGVRASGCKENLAGAGAMPAGNAGVVPVVPERSSPVVERLTEAGAVILRSTVMPKLGDALVRRLQPPRHHPQPVGPGADHRWLLLGAGAAAAGGYAPLDVGTDACGG